MHSMAICGSFGDRIAFSSITDGVGELEIIVAVRTTARPWLDMVEGRATLFPERWVDTVEAVFRHRFAAQGTQTRLGRP